MHEGDIILRIGVWSRQGDGADFLNCIITVHRPALLGWTITMDKGKLKEMNRGQVRIYQKLPIQYVHKHEPQVKPNAFLNVRPIPL